MPGKKKPTDLQKLELFWRLYKGFRSGNSRMYVAHPYERLIKIDILGPVFAVLWQSNLKPRFQITIVVYDSCPFNILWVEVRLVS
jgi:hypothetical protein